MAHPDNATIQLVAKGKTMRSEKTTMSAPVHIGTVLPTKASLAINEAYAKRVASDKERVASSELKHCTRKVVGGEVRYYDTTDQYAIVSRQGKVLWFAVTPDGDYRI